MVRQELRAALEQDPAIVVIGEAADVSKAVKPLHETMPDVVILSTHGGDCADTVRTVRLTHRFLRVVALSSQEESGAMVQALRAGSHGLVVWRTSAKTLVDAVRAVRAGGVFVSDEASGILLDGFALQRRRTASSNPCNRLSDHE